MQHLNPQLGILMIAEVKIYLNRRITSRASLGAVLTYEWPTATSQAVAGSESGIICTPSAKSEAG
jgi:hypothetical protein